jgi:predicted RNase H-like HicB family nuclease
MIIALECAQELDGRWIAEVPWLADVRSCGDSAGDAMSKAEILTLFVLAYGLENRDSELVSICLSPPVKA